MKKLLYFTLIFLAISCETKIEKPNSGEIAKSTKPDIPAFLVYGELPPVDYAEDQDSTTTKKFGFVVKRVAGCEVTNSLLDSVHTINKESDEKMIAKYGENWKENFEKKSNLKLAIPDI